MDFIQRDTITIAKDLLGVRVLYHDKQQTYSGYIVETEAYLGVVDQAAHGFNSKRTPKVESLYKEGDTIYAHVMHTHLLINFVTQLENIPEGVLIRAVEPEEGVEAMTANRGKSGIDLTNGPGKWTKAFNIPRYLDGSKLNEGRLEIDTKNRKYPQAIISSRRIGIPNKGDWTYKPLRYTVRGNPYVSHMRKSDMLPPQDTWR
ncbi:3-methyladenine DNA glycosylase [Staphylococcus arlettae]|uniref:DNA-3-methyladenine glycosylase n=1 Tax=Staphylococcus arlettae TaxID=29378 RepID=UPI000D19C734|nr:DNA-3-methyladenine glycosylase [Staphylococcus arlettae]PTH53430.1 3-methyladenine DNA glycosylase [Staphylococcus arlettae]